MPTTCPSWPSLNRRDLTLPSTFPLQFADGGFYVKSKLETVARDILNSQYAKDEERKKAEAEAPPAALKDDDVMYLVCSRFLQQHQPAFGLGHYRLWIHLILTDVWPSSLDERARDPSLKGRGCPQVNRRRRSRCSKGAYRPARHWIIMRALTSDVERGEGSEGVTGCLAERRDANVFGARKAKAADHRPAVVPTLANYRHNLVRICS